MTNHNRNTLDNIAWRCPHCDSTNELLLPGGPRTFLGVTHEPGCPDFHDVDSAPAVEHVDPEIGGL